jgi:hypothetical protein
MSPVPRAGYTFLPWVQRGLARASSTADTPGAPLRARVTLPIDLQVEGVGLVKTSVRVYGPGDVTGLDRRQIVRTEPRPGTTTFEPGYMPAVEFARADLPWLFTPAAPDGSRLRPWLALIAVRRQDGVRLDPRPNGPLPVLEIGSPARAADELPDLEKSWAWAHAQIAGMPGDQTPAQILDASPGVTCSRLICPRRLEAGQSYLACLVPAFAIGVKAGLGDPIAQTDEDTLAPAWTRDTATIQLPIYFSWEFATAPAGSFETLVRRLTPRPVDPAISKPPNLDISHAGSGLPAVPPDTPGAVIGMQTALRAPGDDAMPAWDDRTKVPFQKALVRLMSTAPADTITAPIYGQVQAEGSAGNPSNPSSAGGAGLDDATAPPWLREVNLDPRLRVAAAAGAQVVRARQEQLMARAWTQAGAIRDANARLRQAQLARELGGVLMERHLQRFSASELLAITQPAHARADLSSQQTVDGELRASRLPGAVVSGAMRRLASPQGLLARRATTAAAPRRGPIDVVTAVDRVAITPPAAAPIGIITSDIAASAPIPAIALRPALSAQSLQPRLLVRLRPEATVLDRTKAHVGAPAGTWTRPDPLAPVATGLQFPEPMYDGLNQVAPRLLLPGLDRVEPDSVALLETSPRVIEAFMIGLNHEMSRELLWREFPADLTDTPFRQFWDVRGQAGDPDTLKDIPPLAEWGKTALGTHLRGSNAGGQLVLLVRGELLRRYPTTTIYAVKSKADGTLDTATRLAPMFRGFVAPDVVFVGFALTEEAALGTSPAGPGWYFAFEEHPGEPRFGLDEEATVDTPASPDDLAWPHVAVTKSGHVDLSQPLKKAGPDLQQAWGRDAATMARLLFQQPFRIAIHASKLLRAEGRS